MVCADRVTMLAPCFAMAAAFAPAVGLAQAPDAGGETAATEAFDQGVEAAHAGRWDEALDHFSRALEHDDDPRIRMNLATAQAQIGQLLEAEASYREALEALPADEVSLRAAIEEALETIDARIPRLRVSAEGSRPDDVVAIGGREVTPGEEVRLNPGHHTVTLRRGETPLARLGLELAEGERRSVELSAPGAGSLTDDESQESLASTAPDAEGTTWWPWVVGGAAVVVATIAVVLVVGLSAAGDQDGGMALYEGTAEPGVLIVR